MDSKIITIQGLLQEVAEHLKSGTQQDRKTAAAKLHRIAGIASTLAFTINAKR